MAKNKNKVQNVNVNSKITDPRDKLAVLRAQQLIGKVDPKLYEETRQEVISSIHPKTKELWEFLEDTYDCEVCELEFSGKGVYGFKIRTPEGTFLDYGTKKEIIKLMESLDIKYDDEEPSGSILN
jgi:rubredoxin